MGVAPEAAEEVQQLLMQHRVIGDVMRELFLLGSIRQRAILQQIADLHEVAMFGEIFDRIAAMQQNAGVAVDIGDLRFARCGRREAGIVGEITEFFIQRPNIDDFRSNGTGHQREIRRFAGRIVRDGDGFLRHASTPRCDGLRPARAVGNCARS